MVMEEPNGERLSVGVIFGGRSVEHDVSVVTAHQAMSVLSARHDVVPIYVTREGRWLTSPALNDLSIYRRRAWDEVGEEAFIPPVAGYGGLQVAGGRLRGPRRVALDVVVPAIHGTYGEDGTLQGLLELADIPYTGSGVTASAAGMDKIVMKDIFAATGLPLVRHFAFDTSVLDSDFDAAIGRIEDEIGYPAFVKPARLGSSVGIGRAADRRELGDALDVARRYDHRLIVEVGMQGCIEVNCSVLGGPGLETTASVCEQPVPWQEFLTFSDKYLRGSKGSKTAGMASQERRIPAPISPELTERVQKNAVAAYTSINASGVARIDSFVNPDSGETWIMEINTVPGSFSFYLWEASGVPFDALMEKLIGSARAAHARKKELMFSYDSGMLQASSFGAKSG